MTQTELTVPGFRTQGRAICRCRPAVELLEDRCLLSGDMVLHWNDVLMDAVRADRTAPPLAARNMAIVHIAVYDAVNAIYQTHEPYAVRDRGPGDASPEAAVAAAAHRTLSHLFPAQRMAFDAELAASLDAIPDGPAENRGVALGRSMAQVILAQRLHDGADREVTYTIGSEPGDWQPTPPAFQQTPALPQWPDVTPFAMESGSQFRPPAPPDLTSAEYAASFEEVRLVGAIDAETSDRDENGQPDRTPEQTEIARFWINGPGTATPPGHWNEVAQVVAESEGTTLAQNARLFALLNIALADAGIVSWDCKYEFNLWRPVTGIRRAEIDGNPDTAAEVNWTPLIVTPPFPAYTSGHGTFSAAGAAVLADYFGTDNIAFTLRSETPEAADRSFTSFSEAAEESGVSRIYGGIHWNFDNVQGLSTGVALGHFTFQNYLRPRAPSPSSPNLGEGRVGAAHSPGEISGRGLADEDPAGFIVIHLAEERFANDALSGTRPTTLLQPSPSRTRVLVRPDAFAPRAPKTEAVATVVGTPRERGVNTTEALFALLVSEDELSLSGA